MADARKCSVLMVTGRTVGGAAEHVLLLSRLLDRTAFDVHVALLGTGPLDDELRSTGVPVHQLRPRARSTASSAAVAWSGGPLGLVTGAVRLFRLLRRERFDVVHTHTAVAGVVGRLAAWTARTPVRVHMAHSVPAAQPGSPVRRAAARVVERLLAPRTTVLVAGSAAAAAAVRATLGRCRTPVRTIHNAIDLERFAAGTAAAAERRKTWHPDGDEVVIGIVGRLEPQKGVAELLPALPPLFARCPRARLVLVGDGSLRAGLERQVSELGLANHVELVGWVASGGDVIPALDVLALPSRWEPFGIVSLEAAAAGVPVVAFAVDGVPEVVIDGETGVLVPSGDTEAFVDALAALADDAARRAVLGDGGRRRLDRFSPTAMVAAHEQLYADALARRR